MSDFDFSAIGKKIRTRRKELGLTQHAVCDDMISRNMLSLIENGEAKPSLDTLIYISDRLNVPPAYFLCRNDAETAQYEKASAVSEIRSSYSAGYYRKCYELCQSIPFDEETAPLYVSSRIRTAVSEFDNGNFNEFFSELKEAEKVCRGSGFNCAPQGAEISFLLQMATDLSNGQATKATAITGYDSINLSFTRKIYMLFVSLSENGEEITLPEEVFPKKSPYRAHFEAKKLMSSARYDKALEVINSVASMSPDTFASFFMMKDSEQCAVKLGDFEKAYALASAKQRITDALSKAIKKTI